MSPRAAARVLAALAALTAADGAWYAARGVWDAATIDAVFVALMACGVLTFALAVTAKHADNVTELQFGQAIEAEAA